MGHQTALLKQKHIWRQIAGVAVWEIGVMALLFIFGPLACGSPVYRAYADTKTTRPDGCPKFPNDPTAENFGYTAEQLADVDRGNDCATYIGAQAKLAVQTYAFNTFCFMNMFNLINCRKVGIEDNNV